MSPRKPVNKTRVPSSLRDGDCGEEEDLDEEVKEILPEERPHSSFSSPQRRERVVKPKPREMTEEEMMDLALRLSEQEASMAAVKHQREEDAMREALKESMFSQTQPCALPPSQSYHGNTQPLPKLSRRKLAYPATAGQDAVPVEDLTAVPSPEPAWRGNHNNNSKRKRKREDRGPPPQRPDLPQTQKICSQDSEPEPLCPQDFPSTPTQPRRLAKTFTPPSTPSPPCVQLLRMNPGILQTCRTSGFVLCSPLSLTSTQTGPPSPSRSPTFPSGATHSDDAGRSKAPTFPQSTDCSDPDLEIVGETDPNLDSPSSPVFGRGESIMPLDDTGFAPKSPLFGRNVPTRASDCGAPTAAWDRGQRSPAPHGDQKEKLKASKLSHSKRRMYTESYCLSKGLTCPQSPLGVQVSPGGRLGGVEDGLEQSFSSPAEHCTTSPIFGKSAQAIGVTRPVFGEESPVLGNSSPPEMESGPGSPIFGRTSPLFGRTGTNKTTSSPQGSAVNSKEARQPAPCPQKTNGLSHEDEESEPTPGAVRPTRAHLAGTEEQSRGGGESVPESGTLTSDMTLQWSDEEEDPCVPSSPVFPEERLAGEHRTPPEHAAPALLGTHTSPAGRHTPFGPQCSGRPKCRRWGPALAPVAMEGAGSDPSAGPGPSHTQGPPDQVLAAHPEQPRGEPVVHYFWGVPFCPQGLDPDLYTQVILAQMEVYEKSLKQAQRGLLRKAEWGDGITPKTEDSFEDSPELIPTISLTRRGLRSRRRPSGGRPPEEEEEEEDGEEGGGKDADQEAQTVAPVEEGEEELDVVGCDVCPETQLSGDETQDLMMDTAAGAETQPGSPSLLKVQSLLRGEGGEGEQREEENLTQDQDKKESEEEGDGGGDSEPLAVMRPSRELIEEEEEEEENEGALEVAAATAAVSSVNCPICQHAFPTAQIEVHAAYCDGEQEVVECADDHSPVAQRPSKRRALKSLATEGRGDNGELSGAAKAPVPQQREKCFVCHKFVPMADFLRHTESCIQRQRTAADASKGDLLSALETTDSRAPGGSSVSVSRASREVIVLSCNDDDDDEEEEDTGESGSAFRVSDSPIRAFRSISEASDCLVDFRRQGAARPPAGQRTRGRGRGGGVKRKFKRR